MYSGTTFRTKSGRIMGVHQKIDRIARRELLPLLADQADFPATSDILHFEGLHGPDGIKRKSPGRDEPWHFINPDDPNDTALLDMVDSHIANLAVALRTSNHERAAFEAAWMAHAITDGLTPPHHYPLREKLAAARGGEGLESRNSKKSKILLPGKTRRQQFKNNWEFWGAKGVMTTHFAFEHGVATVIAPHHFMDSGPTESQVAAVKKAGFRTYYQQTIHDIYELKMFDNFVRDGWSKRLARDIRTTLLPTIIEAVVLGWYSAYEKSRHEN